MTASEIRKKYIEFWTSKPRNHKEIPNASLVPVGDSTILFVNSGMFPLVPYLSGEPHPLGKRLVNFQRSLRTDSESIEEIGDNRHTLMFEMMGNWSLGDYFKAEQLPWCMEFFHEVLGLEIGKLYVSVFAGNDAAPRDDESIEIWKSVFAKYGIEALVSDNPQDFQKNTDPKKSYRIFTYPAKKNWWQRGEAKGEIGGPDSEVFYDLGPAAEAYPDPDLHINSDNGRFIEIGNSVFIQYQLDEQLKWQPLKQKNVDFGGGFERVVMCVQGKSDMFDTDIFEPLIKKIEELTGQDYAKLKQQADKASEKLVKAFRVLADHARGSTFILADGIVPAPKDQGYILRRFIRRLVRFGLHLELTTDFTAELAQVVIESMSNVYPQLLENKDKILSEITAEERKFRKNLGLGLATIRKTEAALQGQTNFDYVSGKLNVDHKEQTLAEIIFYNYETNGFPPELFLEELKPGEQAESQIYEQISGLMKIHADQSRIGAEQKFRGGLADSSEEVTKLHTAHHLLLRALQIVLGDHVKQRGSNITAERLRIDFSHNDKMTPEQIKEVEDIVNEQIQTGLPVTQVMMPKSEAEKLGAEMEFGQKYPDTVSVYFVGDQNEWFSAEFCGGPHVGNTAELAAGGKRFKILKEESSSSGVRRIKAALV